MNSGFPKVALSEVLQHNQDYIEAPEPRLYPKLSVKLYGKGVVLDAPADGSSLKMKRHQLARSGQVILSEIWGKKGAIGFVPTEGEGALCTSHFFLFDVRRDLLEPKYLQAIFTANYLEGQLGADAKGTTGYAAVRPKNLLAAKIPLPPFEEQQRIVARIDELAAKIAEARGLRQQSQVDMERLLPTKEFQLWPEKALKHTPSLEDVTIYLSRGRHSEQGASDHHLIKTQHVQMGRYIKSSLTLAAHIAAKVPDEAMAKEGDILIACSAAGCLGRVARFTGAMQTASTDTHVAIARANPSLVLPEYLYAYLKSAQGQLQLRSRERGDWTREKVGFRLTELNLKDLKKVPVPLPSFEEQRRLVAYLNAMQERVDALKKLQAETAAELDALLPSILDKAFKGEL
jgi:type I restriction enzyme, S subunit